MKKIIILIALLIVMSIPAYASTIIPVPVNVSVQFLADRQIIVNVGNTGNKVFQWTNDTWSSQTTTYSQNTYTAFDEATYCSTDAEAQQYKNLTENLGGVLNLCAGLMPTINESAYYREQYNKAQLERDNAYYLYKEVYNQTEQYKNESGTYKSQYDTCSSSLMMANAELANTRPAQQLLNTCNADLTKTKNDVTTGWLFGALLGAGAMIVYQKSRAPKASPSEMGETSAYDKVDQSKMFQQPPNFMDHPEM